MKNILLLTMVLVSFGSTHARERTYEVPYVEELPDGVAAWQYSGLLQNKREARFEPYDKKAAEQLILDATAERGVTKEESALGRETAFRAAYDERGVGIYIEAQEPLIRELLDASVDPTSPAMMESFEVFFAPGLHEVPYYQMFIHTVKNTATFYDWGSPHRDYRSLKNHVQIEAKPSKAGFGLSIFIPWESIYENLPWENDTWRFSVIRWMPFGKAGGVTWGGRVHETGQFGLLRFQKPTAEQRLAIEGRLARYAWFHFLARAKEAEKFWSDEKIGDVEFYKQTLKPVIEEYTNIGETAGLPDEWTMASLDRIKPEQKDWLEFSYKVSELREKYLLKKRFEDAE